ncbi:MAG: DUF4112 domain-containing protein [Chloroflexi bacterium]|nr:DUF4112 domain-containing protein [Chloroflexota bacterium]
MTARRGATGGGGRPGGGQAGGEAGHRAKVDATRRHVAAMAWLLDETFAVPGKRHRFGLGPLIGLVPVVGDLVGAAAGSYIVLRAIQTRLPRVVIAQMAFNVLLNVVVGVVPLAGDAFDFFYKSNTRNLRLFERHALDPTSSTRGSWLFFGVILAVLVALIVLAVVVLAAIAQAILGVLQG